MSKPRYSCVESQAITSPANVCARKTPSADLPEAVGPTIASSGGETEEMVIETRYARRAQQEQSEQRLQAGGYPELVDELASFVSLLNWQVVIVREPQLDIRPAERWRQRFERIGSANRGDRGAVERLLFRGTQEIWFAGRYAAIAHD